MRRWFESSDWGPLPVCQSCRELPRTLSSGTVLESRITRLGDSSKLWKEKEARGSLPIIIGRQELFDHSMCMSLKFHGNLLTQLSFPYSLSGSPSLPWTLVPLVLAADRILGRHVLSGEEMCLQCCDFCLSSYRLQRDSHYGRRGAGIA